VSDWDENTLKEKGHGGSETAAIEVARWIKKKTGRPVKIFHPRMARQTMESGVEYIPSSEASGYFRNVEPHVCISWRNAFKLTAAKNYVWCHDLQLPFGHLVQNYDKVIALSEFHKNYLKEVSGVPFEKCIIGFNGINPDDFPKEPVEKDPLKVVFSSSPDRGIEQAIDVVKLARDKSGLDIKLHCFYGTENMRKSGQVEWADAIEKKIKENSDFVISHGMVPKKELMMHFAEAGTWLYINNFLETFCITALEAICSKTWPIFRKIAALPYTLKDAIDRGHCDMILSEAKEDTYDEWADKLISAIQEKKWEKMDFKAEDYSWEKVADFFIKEMEL
jgi:glycosyltransferase involved in cell wall biosynthesis